MVTRDFIERYVLLKDSSRPGRMLETVKVGDVYVTRVTIMPGVVTGNVFHKKTSFIQFVTEGTVEFMVKQMGTGEESAMTLTHESGIIHVPPHVAVATKNKSRKPAVIVYFSNRQFRSGDDYPFELMEKKEKKKLKHT